MKISLADLNFYSIEKFKNELNQSLLDIEESTIELDFSIVEKIDLVSIQLLLSLNKYCNNNSLNLKCININAKQVKQKLKLFNLNETLGVIK
ncbi:MAG: STAS domain-containing protein [Campylobacterota bacterium]|nr:STAS domain-containing protein [Campylobacterota bacterium]